jgi:hypothetical protein
MRIHQLAIFVAIALSSFSTSAFCAYSSTSSQQPMPPFPTAPSEAPSQVSATPPISPLKKEPLPIMQKPFGMPGVVGVVDKKWENSDYLGYLSHNIPVTVELLLGKNVPPVDPQSIEKALTTALQKGNILNQPESREGPIFPFIHFLVVVYAAEDNRFVVFTSFRLFEQVIVVRKRFSPAGFWQGITWENQDVTLTDSKLLQTQINSMADKLATLFVSRYQEYNKDLDKENQEDTTNQ